MILMSMTVRARTKKLVLGRRDFVVLPPRGALFQPVNSLTSRATHEGLGLLNIKVTVHFKVTKH